MFNIHVQAKFKVQTEVLDEFLFADIAQSKEQTEVLDEFLFADDMAKGASTQEKMQKNVDQVSDSWDSYDLTI